MGSLAEKLKNTASVERDSSYPGKIKGSCHCAGRRVRNVRGTGKRSIRAKSAFCSNDASSVAKGLPQAVTVIRDMITVVLASKGKVKLSDMTPMQTRNHRGSH